MTNFVVFEVQHQRRAMAIQCGVCKNIMPSSSFLSHRERKHSMLQRVPYVKMPDDVLKGDSGNGPMVKCRFCPNRIPSDAMERHLQRCHIECRLCQKTLLKSNYEKHLQQKHGSNLSGLSSLSQSKSSIQSDCDMAASTLDSVSESSLSPIPFETQSPAMKQPDVIHVDIWQLKAYIRQGRVYTKDGSLYLRNTLNVL